MRRLDLFGSAAGRADFTEESDFDFLVSYEPDHPAPALGDFLALRDSLAALLGRPIDLVMEPAVRNPYLRPGIERSSQEIYGAINKRTNADISA